MHLYTSTGMQLQGIFSGCSRTALEREGGFYGLVVTSPPMHTLVKGASAFEAMHMADALLNALLPLR